MKKIKKVLVHEKAGHKVHIVGYEQISSGGLVLHLSCCDQPHTHPAAFYHAREENGQIINGLGNTTVMDKVKNIIAPNVADEHIAMDAAKKLFDELDNQGPNINEGKATMTLHN